MPSGPGDAKAPRTHRGGGAVDTPCVLFEELSGRCVSGRGTSEVHQTERPECGRSQETLFAQKQGLFEGNEILGPGDPDARARPSDHGSPS